MTKTGWCFLFWGRKTVNRRIILTRLWGTFWYVCTTSTGYAYIKAGVRGIGDYKIHPKACFKCLTYINFGFHIVPQAYREIASQHQNTKQNNKKKKNTKLNPPYTLQFSFHATFRFKHQTRFNSITQRQVQHLMMSKRHSPWI